MFKLFLVDDEIDSIEGVKSLIPWNDYKIEVCGEANDGLTALKDICNIKPDILIVDIRMPKMDGLDLLSQLKVKNINVKSIILSGYEDFQYAKKAINLNIIDYLLKPCKPDEIIQAVLKAKKIIEEEQEDISTLEKYKLSHYEIISQKRNDFVKKLALGKIVDTVGFDSEISSLGIKVTQGNCLVAVTFSIDNKNKILDKSNIGIINANILPSAKKYFSNDSILECFEINEDTTIIFYINKLQYNSSAFLENIYRVKLEIETLSKVTLTVGVGSIAKEISEIKQSYEDSRAALEAKFYLGNNRVINLKNIDKYEERNDFYPINEEKDIINCIETRNTALMNQKVELFFNKLCGKRVPTKGFLQKITISFCSRIYEYCISKNINTSGIFDSNLRTFDKILECETVTELKEYVGVILNKIISKTSEINKKNIFIKMAVEYIMENYSKNISLEIIAKKLYITPGYLSLLFKHEMGVNFLDFIVGYRVEKAKEFLKTTSLKNYEVSNLVGFSDEKYFSQIFKKHVGMTPTQYRQK